MKVLFCTSNSLASRLIRLVTWSDWSHVAIIYDDVVIEAVWPRVRVAPLADVLAKHTNYAVVNIPFPDEEAAIAWAVSQVGKPYDLLGMLGLGFNRDWQDDAKWWCSELAAFALMMGGFKPFRDGAMHRISPEDLWRLNFPVVDQSN